MLLLERLKNRSMSQENAVIQNGGTPKHALENQRRRPSSIAEQAMRKLGLGTHQRYFYFIYKTTLYIITFALGNF